MRSEGFVSHAAINPGIKVMCEEQALTLVLNAPVAPWLFAYATREDMRAEDRGPSAMRM
jgi:hypothetical protein